MNFSVGQIIYLLSRTEIKVYPAQVVEEIKRKTLDEELTSYVIRLPDKERSEVLLEEIKAEIFTSIQDLEKAMLENAREQISEFLKRAVSLESAFKPKDTASREKIEITDNVPGDKIEIDLGDGVSAKIKPDDIDQINM